ncbi:MAG: hypothetical protein OEL88_10755 [Sterolibacteriaceae bacterium MAG5]|nr:hypothetical protein [Candidatus Nitricoxidireducens bremensis]
MLKKAGIEISNEAELRERLAEVQHWQYAFKTLAANGRQLGIRFDDRSAGTNEAEIRRAFAEFRLPQSIEAVFNASLKAEH